jgi:hypothetical protein
LGGIVSEDSVRRALKAIEPAAGENWMRSVLMDSVREALDRPWVLDMDVTIKPLYGHQEGAELGYNPHQPGRHLRTSVGNRARADAVSVQASNTVPTWKALLVRLLDELGDRRPNWCAVMRLRNEDIINYEQRRCRTCCGCAKRPTSSA